MPRQSCLTDNEHRTAALAVCVARMHLKTMIALLRLNNQVDTANELELQDLQLGALGNKLQNVVIKVRDEVDDKQIN